MATAFEQAPLGASRVEPVVFALEPPLATRAAPGLEDAFAAAAQMASKPGAVMTRSFNRPNANTACVLSANRSACA
jgi:hypothetical protein